jgi:1-aminocyclopropane-1-carboxylate deaminase/D-cysteine desulfhydrase-like pyridoxal-dependent ACC family enzyme
MAGWLARRAHGEDAARGDSLFLHTGGAPALFTDAAQEET